LTTTTFPEQGFLTDLAGATNNCDVDNLSIIGNLGPAINNSKGAQAFSLNMPFLSI
jgi:hypothetical protein